MGILKEQLFKLLLKTNKPKLRLNKDWLTVGMNKGYERELGKQGLLN